MQTLCALELIGNFPVPTLFVNFYINQYYHKTLRINSRMFWWWIYHPYSCPADPWGCLPPRVSWLSLSSIRGVRLSPPGPGVGPGEGPCEGPCEGPGVGDWRVEEAEDVEEVLIPWALSVGEGDVWGGEGDFWGAPIPLPMAKAPMPLPNAVIAGAACCWGTGFGPSGGIKEDMHLHRLILKYNLQFIDKVQEYPYYRNTFHKHLIVAYSLSFV